MDELAGTADVGVRRSVTATFALGLVESFNVSTIKRFGVCGRGRSWTGRGVSDTDVRLTFVKSVYLMVSHISPMRDVALNNEFISEPAEYEKWTKLFAMDMFEPSAVKINNFILAWCGGAEGTGLWFEKILQFFWEGVRKINES